MSPPFCLFPTLLWVTGFLANAFYPLANFDLIIIILFIYLKGGICAMPFLLRPEDNMQKSFLSYDHSPQALIIRTFISSWCDGLG